MMYTRPELSLAHERYWQLIRTNLHLAGIDSPEHLAQDAEEFFVWKHPKLVLSQTCGMPYRTWLKDSVNLVGTPDFDLDDCPPGYYRSALVVRAGDARESLEEYRDAVFAYNQTFSQSGYAAPYWHLKRFGFWFKNRLHTGQHRISAKAVADGRAELAALDAVSWRFINRYDDFIGSLRVLEWTEPTPGLPLITAKANDAHAIYQAVDTAIHELTEEDRQLLGLRKLVRISMDRYTAIANPPRQVLGY